MSFCSLCNRDLQSRGQKQTPKNDCLYYNTIAVFGWQRAFTSVGLHKDAARKKTLLQAPSSEIL
jgi:hypothetical protein